RKARAMRTWAPVISGVFAILAYSDRERLTMEDQDPILVPIRVILGTKIEDWVVTETINISSSPATALPALIDPRKPPAKLIDDVDRAAEYARGEKAKATRRA